MAKDSFILYTSFYNPISRLSDKQLGRLFRAIFKYNLSEVVNVEEDIEMAFGFFVNQFEIDEAKYQSKIKRDIENGRKGGNPNFKRGQRNPYYFNEKDNDNPGFEKITQDNPRLSEITQDNPRLSEITQDNPRLSEITQDNLNDNVNDNVNDIIVELDKSNSMSEISISDSAMSKESLSRKQEIIYLNLQKFFNQQMEKEKAAISRIQVFTDKRKRAVNARCREYGKEAIFSVIVSASKSDFLNGKNNRNWIASFDWLFLPNNFAKVLEGNYDNKNFNDDYHNKQSYGAGNSRNETSAYKGKIAPDYGLILD